MILRTAITKWFRVPGTEHPEPTALAASSLFGFSERFKLIRVRSGTSSESMDAENR